MDPSALIFVALVVAWAVYLVPKALEHHDESLRQRAVNAASTTKRVLARRGKKQERLVTADGAVDDAGPAPRIRYVDVPVELTVGQRRARRDAARRATRRRRRVLAVLVLALAAVSGVAGYGLIDWYWDAIPGALLLGWLLACRLTVRKEQVVPTQRVPVVPVPLPADAEESEADVAARMMVVDDEGHPTGTFVAIDPETSLGRWDPVHVPLPTYVSKPAAARTVGTIDLDSTGVWSSGRNEADSALAREADDAAAAARAAHQQQPQRAAGS